MHDHDRRERGPEAGCDTGVLRGMVEGDPRDPLPLSPTDRREDQPRHPDFDTVAYRARNEVARPIGRLKPYRHRYEKRGADDLAMVTLGVITFGVTMPRLT